MATSFRDPNTKRMTPLGRSILGAGVLVAAAAAYFVVIGFWVTDAETRSKFQQVDPAIVESVETDLGEAQHTVEAATHRQVVTELVYALRQARTRQGYKPPKDAAPGYIRVRTALGDKIENVTVFFPADSIRDRFGPEVDKAVQTVHAAGRPKG